MVHCRECGEKISDSAVSCPKCGARQKGVSNNDKNKTAAGLLGIFLGGIGVHKFYLGKTGLGFVYLIFFWTFIPAIIGFIEGVIYLTMKQDDFERKYLEK